MVRPTTVSEPPIRSPVLSALGAGLPAAMVFIAVLTIPLSAATDLGLSRAGLTGWILALRQ